MERRVGKMQQMLTNVTGPLAGREEERLVVARIERAGRRLETGIIPGQARHESIGNIATSTHRSALAVGSTGRVDQTAQPGRCAAALL